MAITVRENWSARKLSLRWPWNAYREFTVVGTTVASEALAAVDPSTGLAIPQEKEGHDANPDRILCVGPEVVDSKGVDYWVIGCNYQASDTGGSGTEPDHTEDPLQEPAEIQWDHAEETEPVDRDLGNRPILNTAGFAEYQVSRTVAYKKFRIVKNFPFFDLLLAKAYDNSVNSAPITLGLGITAAAQHLRCVSIVPAAPYRASATYIPIAFNFELVSEGTLGLYPFQHRLMDQGSEGWTSGGKHFKFTVSGADGPEEVSSPVRLDGTGKPLTPVFANVKVGSDLSAPASPSTAIDTYAKETLSGAVFLYYQKTRVVDLSPLVGLL